MTNENILGKINGIHYLNMEIFTGVWLSFFLLPPSS